MIQKIINWCIHRRLAVAVAIALVTALMGVFAARVEVKTVFSDLLPQNHPYIDVHNRFKQTFGGSNMVSIMVEVEKGDVLAPAVLGKIQKITRELEHVKGVDSFQIVSLASKKLKEIKSSTEGIQTRPLMWPDLPRDETRRHHTRAGYW